MKRYAVALFVLVCAASLLAQLHWPNMTTVNKIFVNKLGNNDEAERFRFQLSRELANVGFTPLAEPDEADAIVKGTFSYQNWNDKSGAQANLRLLSQEGKEIWGLSVADKKIDSNHDSGLWVAREVSKKLKEQKEKELKWMRENK